MSNKINKNKDSLDKKDTLKDKKNELKNKKDTNKSKKNKDKKNIFKSITKYFKGVIKEVKRIRWTNLNDLVKYSVATLVIVLFLGLYFYGIDWLILIVRSLVK